MIACVIMTRSLLVKDSPTSANSGSSLSTSTLGVKNPFHYLTMWWRWGRGSFASFTMLLPLPGMEVGEGLIYIIRVSPSTLNGDGGGAHLNSQCHSLYIWWRWGGAHLHHPQSVSLYVGWRWGTGSFTSSTECLHLPWWHMGTGLI